MSSPELLSQGAYGCVFRPGIKCDGTLDSDKVITKIQVKKARTEDEPRIGEILYKSANHEKYFAPVEKVCKASLSTIESQQIKRCEIWQKNKESKEFVACRVRYVGEDTLGIHMDKYKTAFPVDVFSHLWDTHMYLADALEILETKRIVHHDIKENNIVFHEKYHHPVLIDFGVGFHLDHMYSDNKLREIFFTHYEKYPPWCIDILCIASIVENEGWEKRKVDVNRMETIINTVFEDNDTYKICSKIGSIQNEKKKWIQYVHSFSQKQGKGVVNELLMYWNTWDMYSVNVMILMLINDYKWLHEEGPMKGYVEYLVKQILSIPSKRNTIERTIEYLEGGTKVPPDPLLGM